MHYLFGIVDYSNLRKYVYMCEDSVSGDQDSNHVLSFLFYYVERMVQPRALFFHLYMDLSPYSKSKFIVWWTTEMVKLGRFQRAFSRKWNQITQILS